jgi:ATP-dependent DNA helicase RecQ
VRKSLGDSARETLRRFRAGESIEQIARDRDVTTGTIMSHIAEGIERGEPVDLTRFFTDEEKEKVAAAFGQSGFGNLGGVFETLGGAIEYGKLRIFRAAANARKTVAEAKR